jgi:hypothetical protein
MKLAGSGALRLADVRGGRRHLLHERGDGLEPRRRVGIFARDIDVGIEPAADIPGRIAVRLIGVLQPEELAFGHLHHIVALIALLRRQPLECLRLRDHPAQEVAALLEPVGAPVGQFPVEIVPALIDRERRIDREPLLGRGLQEFAPVFGGSNGDGAGGGRIVAAVGRR